MHHQSILGIGISPEIPPVPRCVRQIQAIGLAILPADLLYVTISIIFVFFLPFFRYSIALVERFLCKFLNRAILLGICLCRCKGRVYSVKHKIRTVV